MSLAQEVEGKAKEKHMGGTGGWRNKEKGGGERSKRKVCRGIGREKDMLPVGYNFVPALHSAMDISHENVIRTSPQLSTSH